MSFVVNIATLMRNNNDYRVFQGHILRIMNFHLKS